MTQQNPRTSEQLRQTLQRIEGKNYPLYKQAKGDFHFPEFLLQILHVQGDPFAQPSKIAIIIDNSSLKIQPKNINQISRRIGFEDGILRTFSKVLQRFGSNRGSGKSGQWSMVGLGQEMLARTACEISENHTTLRFYLGLPANGRKILAKDAEEMLLEELPRIISEGIIAADQSIWQQHADAAEDQDVLRNLIKQNKWTAFVANGSLLPRASGVEDKPLQEGPVLWQSPKELETTVNLPNQGELRGSAIKQGITLICGGGFHGKSTLLNALSRGVYNHIPGDGREGCISLYDSVAIRSEDGRNIVGVDISPFINNLPGNKDIKKFSSSNASGSTSQAANIIEAIEMGAKCLLIDEDTSATNFMVRDRRMQELINTEDEPITPFIDRVEELFHQHQVSSTIVVGGSGDYFTVADTVIVLKEYVARVATEQAKSISIKYPADRIKENRAAINLENSRQPQKESFNPRKGHRDQQIRFHKKNILDFGETEVDISLVPQLIDPAQLKSISDYLLLLAKQEKSRASLKELCSQFEEISLNQHLTVGLKCSEGDRSFVRKYELSAAINRMRSLQLRK